MVNPNRKPKPGTVTRTRVLNRFGDTTNGQPVPLGKPWDRQPNSGKQRRKLVSVPGLRRRTPPEHRCRGKVESSAFRRVPDLVILLIFSAIPSTNIVLHRGHP